MRSIVHTVVLLLSLSASGRLVAQSAGCSDGNPHTIVFFVNGIWTTEFGPGGAEGSRDKLSAALKAHLPPALASCVAVDYLFNFHENELYDLIEAVKQRFGAVNISRVNEYLNKGLDTSPDWVQYHAISTAATVNRTTLTIKNLAEHVDRYRREINNNKRTVIVVPHSQGNFFANDAYEVMKLSEGLPDQAKFNIVGVATPDSVVRGYSAQTEAPYVTLCEDFIWKLRPPTIPGESALDWNVYNNLPLCTLNRKLPLIPSALGTGRIKHSFTGSYLGADTVSRTTILSHIASFVRANRPPSAGFIMSAGSFTAVEPQTLSLTIPLGATATVMFDAQNRSSDPDGSIMGYKWLINGTVVSTASNFTSTLGQGIYPVELTVTDNRNAQSPPARGKVVITPQAPVQLSDLRLSKTQFIVGEVGTVTVGLTGAAPSGGAAVQMNCAGATTVPCSITIPGGQSSASHTFTTLIPSPTELGFEMVASYGGEQLAVPFTVTAQPTTYTITDLGTLGGPRSFGLAINGAGQVAGYSSTTGGADHAFLFSGSGMTDLGTLATAATSAVATGINDLGQVAGYSWTGSAQHAFLYSASTGMKDLGTLDGASSLGWAVNSLGQVVGHSVTGTGATHAFLYGAQTGMVDLGTLPGGNTSLARAVNGSGKVVGLASTSNGVTHAFVYEQNSGMTDLGTLGGTSSSAYAVNSAGQVTGSALTSTGVSHAFLFTPGTGMSDLGAQAAGWTSTDGYGINASTQIVGCGSVNNKWRAFLYTIGKGIVDLNTLLPVGSGWTLECAYGINDRGQITGQGINPQGLQRAFLLTPVK